MSQVILVVEDNQQNLELVEFLLLEAGLRVRTAHDGAEMRRELERGGLPTLVLMDIQLPGVDGLTLVAEIRERPEAAGVPIVALTAHAMRGDRERFLDAGCDGYISKPIDVETFADEVRGYLTGTAPRGRAT